MNLRTPEEITRCTLEIGKNKALRPTKELIIQSILAGCYITFGGILSLTAGYGFPEVTAANPGMQKLLSGMLFPIGLILVVVLGADLFTGNNALLVPACMKRHIGVGTVLKNWTLVYLGNFIGAIAFTYFMIYAVGLTSAEPYQSSIIKIAQAKVSMPWFTAMLKGIGANWCVCLAIWLALAGHNLSEKVIGCFLPVMAFVILGYEHSIANMFFIPAGMLEGAQVSVGEFVSANLIPVTIGNILGGALFVGSVQAYLHLKK
ncbi:MAG: formate/nitrite transporter family protein [Paramuribaculum sp.]|nr:formate/nitrite transporter family protein [Paramuribaculum sp.]